MASSISWGTSTAFGPPGAIGTLSVTFANENVATRSYRAVLLFSYSAQVSPSKSQRHAVSSLMCWKKKRLQAKFGYPLEGSDMRWPCW